MNADEPLSEADLELAMRHADGELPPGERAACEARLAREPRLAREVAAQRRLAVMARNWSPRDAALEAWEARESSGTARVLRLAGVVVLCAGVVVLVGFTHFVLTSEYSRIPRWMAYVFEASLVGFVYLLWRAVRARLATRHLDPYRDLER
jgi:anti-sigma factor RsiW